MRDSPETSTPRAAPQSGWFDLVAVLLVTSLSLVTTLNGLNTRPEFGYPTGDVSIYASYAASWLWPDAYVGDPFLENHKKATPAVAILFFHAGLLFRALFGDFGTAFSAMNFPLILAQGLGFYLLGRRLFGTRMRAVILVLATFLPAFGTYWYVQNFALARMWYMALFPYLLIAFLRYGPNPRAWPWLMGAVGLSMHVHPVSAPAVAFALLTGLAAFKPAEWPYWKLIWRLFLGGLAFIGGAVPFAIANYVMTDHGPIADYETFLRVRSWYGNAFVSIGHYVGWMFLRPNTAFLIIAGTLGAIIASWFTRQDRTPFTFLILWCLGLIVASIVFPWADFQIAAALKSRPNLAELVRDLRYLIPVAWIFMLAATFTVIDRILPSLYLAGLKLRPATAVAIVLVGLFGASTKLSSTPPYVFAWYQFIPFLPTLTCWSKGQFLCERQNVDHIRQVIEHLKDVYPKGTRVLPFVERYSGAQIGQEHLAAIIRNTALLPVPFSFHERLLALYADMSTEGHIWRWLEYRNLYLTTFNEFVRHAPHPLPGLQALIKSLNADVLVTEVPLMDWQIRELGRVTYRNDVLTVIDLRNPAP